MVKYLYGKIEYLSPFINGEVGLRFSDLSHYSRLENDSMRDDELSKRFEIDPRTAKVLINDRAINGDNVVGNIVFSLPADNCYCLCLSNRKNDSELFNKFNADVCLEIEIELLVESIEKALAKFQGTKIEHSLVKYFNRLDPPPTIDRKEIAFYKPEFFSHESEYRIVIRFPEKRRAFKTEEGTTVPIFINGESMHLTITHTDPSLNNNYLRGVYKRTPANDV